MFIYKNSFGIEKHTKVDMPLNKEIKRNEKNDIVCRKIFMPFHFHITYLCYYNELLETRYIPTVVDLYTSTGRRTNILSSA